LENMMVSKCSIFLLFLILGYAVSTLQLYNADF
jgi:hypothetical protein